jgi:hypothetical protein
MCAVIEFEVLSGLQRPDPHVVLTVATLAIARIVRRGVALDAIGRLWKVKVGLFGRARDAAVADHAVDAFADMSSMLERMRRCLPHPENTRARC